MGNIRLSRFYSMKVYDKKGLFRGEIKDVILDTSAGRVYRFTTKPFKARSKEGAKSLLKENSFLFDEIKSMDAIILINK